MVVAFSASNLTWDSGTASQIAMNALASKYDGWTLQELVDVLGPAIDWDTYAGWGLNRDAASEELLQYLSLIANNKITSDAITSNEAKAQLEQALADFFMGGDQVCAVAFPCEGLDFTGLSLWYANLSNFKDLTSSQILSMNSIYGATLPDVAFNGTEDFSGMDFSCVDLSKCTGITASQIATADIYGMKISSAQYNEWGSVLQSNFSGYEICVDGEYITIP